MMVTPDSREKIRLKGAPKQYKRGPALTGKARLQRRLHNLALAASRLARRKDPDAPWAEQLADSLRGVVARSER
jgi:hypothetical protein